MSRRTSRLTASAALAVLTLTVTACGSAEPTATAEERAATTSAAPEPAGPVVAEASVPVLPSGGTVADAIAELGDDAVRAGYDEMVAVATQNFDPDTFIADGNNTVDDLAPVLARVSPETVGELRAAAQGCLDAVREDCLSTWALAWFDVGTSATPYTFMPDGSFVVEQSVSDPDAWIEDGAEPRLVVRFTHTAKARVMDAGAPMGMLMVRELTYALIPAPEGSGHRWLIDGMSFDLDASDTVDPFTFEETAA
ncbi:hypothetical protein GCU60_00715 [Blastococcus saxobsidens]|uniref:Lipoprotein n=1 Tax=Blastococcus saxobsidens TaxID=138336 RepID=A0A6L9VXW2_9ACTN|nr:hypothetical protein [Blastococcus saxobsidens]NEK84299.1 hypothetical protein [Blastococcus saxobsidens]